MAIARKQFGGFTKFILRGNVVDLAVGVVIGAAFAAVVQAVVKDLLTPIIAAIAGKADLSGVIVTAGGIVFPIGDLFQAIITFLLTALVVYFLVVMPVNTFMDRYRPETPPAPTKECPECTTKIPKLARRCPQCTAQLVLEPEITTVGVSRP